MTFAPLLKKLGCKPSTITHVINAPSHITITTQHPADATNTLTLIFTHTLQEVELYVPSAINAYQAGDLLWVAYPKKSGNISTNISRDIGWDVLTQANFLPVSIVSIDANWSALRFKQASEIKKLTRNF